MTPADVAVILFIVGVVILFLVMAATRARESARLTVCQNNLAQIGLALAFYDDSQGGLPIVATPLATGAPVDQAPPGPLQALLETLNVPNFLGLQPDAKDFAGQRGPMPEGMPVPGFICPADATAITGGFGSPVSYRANVGDDPAGSDGPFAVGRSMSLREAERRDGLAYTAAFSERLVGDGNSAFSPVNYALTDDVAATGSPGTKDVWKGDAGAMWRPADFRYTLYGHSRPPNAPAGRVARDGRASDVGAMSAHVTGVNVLMLDGSARVFTPSTANNVWQGFGTVGPVSSPPSTEPAKEQ